MFTLYRFAVFSCAAICAPVAMAADTPLGPQPEAARDCGLQSGLETSIRRRIALANPDVVSQTG